MSNQGLIQASIRAATGTQLDYNGDWMALFDLQGIPAGTFNGRMIAWVNARLSSNYSNINDALAALAASEGVSNFSSLGSFEAGRPPGRLNVLFVGQSQAHRMFSAFSGAGITAFETEAAALGYTDVTTIDGAADSLAITFEAGVNSTIDAYLASGNLTEGAAFASPLVANVDASPVEWVDIDVVIYDGQGETDRLAIQDADITEAQFKAAFKVLIDLVKARAPNAIHIVSPCIGNNGLSTDAQKIAWSSTKRAQYEVVAENSYILDAFGVWDETRADAQHRDQAGNELHGERLARLCAHYHNKTVVNPLGASLASGTYDATADTILLTVAPDDGTDFTISEPDGFGIYKNGVKEPNATTVTRVSATTLQLSGGFSITAGDTIVVDFPWGTSNDLTLANIFLDNAANPLPLMARFGLSITDATPPPPPYTPMDDIDAACVADWRAGVQDSYDSAVSTTAFKNLAATGSAYDLVIDTANATFNGSVGDSAAYFTLDGTGKLASIAANTTFINAMHKTAGNDWTFIIAMKVANLTASNALFTTSPSLASGDGCRCHLNTTEALIQTNRGDTASSSSTPAKAVGQGDKYIIDSHDHTLNQTEQAQNTTTLTTVAHVYNATVDDATGLFTLCAETDEGLPWETGNRFYGAWLFNAKASSLNLAAIVAEIEATTPL